MALPKRVRRTIHVDGCGYRWRPGYDRRHWSEGVASLVRIVVFGAADRRLLARFVACRRDPDDPLRAPFSPDFVRRLIQLGRALGWGDADLALSESQARACALIDFAASWARAWERCGIAAPAETPLVRYAEPHRAYHDVLHLAECLAAAQPHLRRAAHPGEVELALWFHDAVYDPTRPDNEAVSADLARAAGAPPRVADLILATRHNAAPDSDDVALVVDADLAILAAPTERFDAYEAAIRREYAHVPDEAFRTGRRAVLERFLARPRIYTTDAFFQTHEAAARANLRRSLERLTM